MAKNIEAQINQLRSMTTAELRTRYREAFGEEARSRNKDYLWKRVAFRMQEKAYGSISERAKQRAQELARDEDLRIKGRPSTEAPKGAPRRDPRLPPPGTMLTRCYEGRDYLVKVLAQGFEYDGKVFRSLSSVARTITSTQWNGFLFFGLSENLKEAVS